MRLSPYDRAQAIIRHPQYLEDSESLQKLERLIRAKPSLKDREKYLSTDYQLTKKWGLFRPQNPKEIRQLPKGHPEYLCLFHDKAVKGVSKSDIIREWTHKIPPGEWPEVLSSTRPTRSLGIQFKPETQQHTKPKPLRKLTSKDFEKLIEAYCLSHLEEGRYLTLMIDLWEKKEKLLKNIGRTITSYRKYIKRPMGRVRETSLDPWKVYDARKEGKTYEEIVMLLDPTQDKGSLLSRIDTARKAYEKACRMIKAVDPTPTIGR